MGLSREAAAAVPPKRVMILGGGFGGVYTALALEKTLARDPDVEVTLVSRDNFFLFTPMLHEVAASDLDLTHIVSPIRKLLRRVNFFNGEVQGIDLDARTVRLSHGADGHAHDVPYDYLVIALGCETNFYDLPGAAEHALTMKTLGDAIHLRNRAIAAMEEADSECAVAMRGQLMTFVVVGGGFAGVETIGAVNDFVRESLKFYPHVSDSQVRMVLIHSGEVILPELGDDLGRYAQRKLTKQGVEIRTQSRVAFVSGEGVTLADGAFIPTTTVVWTAGTTPHALVSMLPCGKVKARLRVDECLRLEGYDNVWALGDSAAVPDSRGGPGKFHPPTAQHALRQGKVAARNVAAAIRGGEPVQFRFKTLGLLATIGRRTGVAKILGIKFSGFFAWFLWRSIYLSKLPRFEKKLRVALDWTLDLFFSKDLVQYLTVRGAAAARAMGASEPAPEPAGRPRPEPVAVEA
jgi:NADH:ubiquinone reductase (H+-translocating)